MKNKFIKLHLFFLLIIFTNSYAQSQQDVQLAQEYLKNSEYDKAALLYEKLLNKAPTNSQYYQNYLQCLTALKQYDEASKVIRKQIKRFPGDLTYYVDLGNVYAEKNDEKAAALQYEEALRDITADMQQISRLANKFQSSGLTDYAINAYLKGKKVLNAENSDLFNIDLATLYAKKNDVPNTITTYLDIMEFNPSQNDFVEGQLQPLIENDLYAKELLTQLYHRIQKQPERGDFSEMLIWYFVQKKDFASGFLQVKALDKRNKEDGQRVFQFAQSAFDEGDYDASLMAYRYIISEKGKNNFMYQPSKASELKTTQIKLTIQNNYTSDDLKKLEFNYEAYFAEFGKNPQTLAMVRDFATFEAKYIHNLEKSIQLLSDAILINTNDKKLTGYLKLDLGDDYVIANKVWDAMLLYGQVDKSFKEDPLGEEARYRNALLSYHIGDFDWSKAQLDVLKGSTSELIANDALALSVFIQDNMGLDTTPEPMKMYARADMLIFQNKLIEALVTLDSLSEKFPQHALADDVLFEKARILLKQKKYTEAAAMFNEIDSNYSFDLLADDALFELAQLYENNLNNKEKAMDLYKQILLKYKGSIYVIEARKRFRDLRGDQPN
ncbi:MAG: tetratricopeptide repeat protein [Chitinophagales bacterium]|nr:tetratricopeptide repeat protein [Chitinophagales bacterium]